MSQLAHAKDTSNFNIPLQKAMIKDYPVQIQIARTAKQRQLGLMYRKSLPDNQGMLFIFEQESKLCFWMKNTAIPLSLAFAGEDLKITDIIELEPFDKTSKCASKPAQYALELNQGWFNKHQVQVGDTLISIE